MSVVGHKNELEILDRLSENLPLCMAFSGPERIGKSLVANDFAKKIGCEVYNLTLDSTELGRELLHSSKVASNKIRKCFIVEVGRNIKAQNILLKQVEDGNKNIASPLFIFIDHYSNLIDTLRSRSVILDFKEIPFELIKEIFEDRLIPYISMGRYSLAKIYSKSQRALKYRGKVKQLFEDNFFSKRIYEVWEEIEKMMSEEKIFSHKDIVYSSKEIFRYTVKSLLVDLANKEPYYNFDIDRKLFKVKTGDLDFVFHNLDKSLRDVHKLKSLFLKIKGENLEQKRNRAAGRPEGEA